MKTALQTYILDIQNGTCKGEEYYLELEKQQLYDGYDYAFENPDIPGEQYFNETFKD